MEMIAYALTAFLSRLIPHLPNMTGMGAMALMGGRRFGFEKAAVLVIISMLISDLIYGFHSSMWAVYGSLLIAAAIGKSIKRSGVSVLIGASIFSSLIFFLFTNFAVWASASSLYPHTIAGLIECYSAGIPFFRNTLIGDVIYLGVFSALSYLWDSRLAVVFHKS